MYAAATSIISTEGIRGLFYGFGATAMRDAPFAGLYVYFYEHSRRAITSLILDEKKGSPTSPPVPLSSNSSHQPSLGNILRPAVNMASGLIGGFIATTLTNPFDMIKTRIQVRPTEYTNTVQAVFRVVREEGVVSLFSGYLPRALRKTLSAAITWTIYEEVVRKGRISSFISTS